MTMAQVAWNKENINKENSSPAVKGVKWPTYVTMIQLLETD